jgi:hypothetical protein
MNNFDSANRFGPAHIAQLCSAIGPWANHTIPCKRNEAAALTE